MGWLKDELLGVFDIGKTNKKFMLFTRDLRPLEAEATRIGEVEISGLLCDDVESVVRWANSALSKWARKMSAIAISTHGATLAFVGDGGELLLPIVSYNFDPGEEVKKEFYERYGSPEELYMKTGTPPLGQLLNAGVQIFWVSRRFPETYKRARVLFYPGYLTKVLSGLDSAEFTSLGCHTYLLELPGIRWSNVAEDLSLPEHMPEPMDVWEALGKAEGVVFTPGIHDSNAALLPYILAYNGDFILASTGTWCVLMYPGAKFAPSRDDLYRDVLYYVDALRRPVKAARFKGGYEFDHYVTVIKEHFRVDPLSFRLNREKASDLLKKSGMFFVPTLTPGTGQFPFSKPRVVGRMEDAESAYYYLNLSLAVQTWYGLNLLAGRGRPPVFVQGGFARNDVYLAYLATLWRGKVIAAEYPEATGLGAAITALCALEGSTDPRKLNLDLPMISGEVVRPLEVEDRYVQEYVERFLALCSSEAPN